MSESTSVRRQRPFPWLHLGLALLFVAWVWIGWSDFDPFVPQAEVRAGIRTTIRSAFQFLVQYLVPIAILVYFAGKAINRRGQQRMDLPGDARIGYELGAGVARLTTPARRHAMPAFQLLGLDHQQFSPLFELGDAELAARDIVRQRATSQPGYPCRISLQDAAVGEELLLLPYAHQAAATPYRSLGPIFVRRGATQAVLPPGVVPDYVRNRLISVRAYDAAHRMVAAEVREGAEVSTQLGAMFEDPAISYIHLHNARRGCYSCLARRPA